MRKLLNVLFVIGIILMLSDTLFRVMHRKDLYTLFIIAGVFTIFLSILLLRIVRARQNSMLMLQFNDGVIKGRRIFNIGITSGAIVMTLGLMLKIARINTSDYFIEGGLGITALFFAFLLISVAGGKEYFVKAGNQLVPIEESELQKFSGTYFSEEINDQMSVWIENGLLMAKLGTLTAVSLSAVKENVFNNLSLGTVVEFKLAKNELALIVNGRYLTFVKQ